MNEEVLIREEPAANGKVVGFITLNAERTLNALTREMVRSISVALEKWAGSTKVACVVIEGTGPKAFCAGGDIQRLYKAILQVRQGDASGDAYISSFFSGEYRLDFEIHNFSKPILCWGHGIVMGGGLGLMAEASHRVVTETSRLAMPEVTIGFFPDVGGTWFLNRMPGRVGLFLALTGTLLNAADALYVGLGDHFLPEALRKAVLDRLLTMEWAGNSLTDRALLSRELAILGDGQIPPASPVRAHYDLIQEITAGGSLAEVMERIGKVASTDPWLQKAAATLAAGSPTSAALAFRFHRFRLRWSLADAFRVEYKLALQCCAKGDLAEGVRALLIDKDKKPRWSPSSFSEVTPEWLDLQFPIPDLWWNPPLPNLGRPQNAVVAMD